MMRSGACLFLMVTATLLFLDSSNAFHLNRAIYSHSEIGRQKNGKSLQYQDDSHVLDFQEGELFIPTTTTTTTSNSAILNYRNYRRYSASDWLYNLKTWRNSSVFRDVRNPVFALGSWATFVSLVFRVFHTTGRSNWASMLSIPPVAHSFLVSSIGLLLVFRTNSAYQRFLEGRKIWEEVSSKSRNLCRFVTIYSKEVGNDRRERILHLLAAFPYLLRHQVRNGCLCSDSSDLIDEKNKLCLLEPNIPEQHCFVDRTKYPWSLLEKAQKEKSHDILGRIAQVTNRPLWICDCIGQEIMEIPMSPNFSSRERLKLLSDVDQLANAIGSCERIHQTAVPLHYARHALRSLSMWIVTLPFSLVQDLGLLTGPVTAIVAWLLFGVYQIGHSIEDPFQGSLRLSTLCENIRRGILQYCDTAQESSSNGRDTICLPELDLLARSNLHSTETAVETAYEREMTLLEN